MRRAVSLVALVLMATSATSEPFQFAEWAIPVPAGTRIVEHPAVSIESRQGRRIELVEDVVIGPRGADANYAFYEPASVAVDDDGRLYVVDTGNRRVQVFTAAGQFLHTLGRGGQGPGEFTLPLAAAISGDHVVISDPPVLRLSIWDLEGNHVGTRVRTGNRMVDRPMFGTENGSFVSHYAREVNRVVSWAIVKLSIEGEELLRLAEFETPPHLRIRLGGGGLLIAPDDLSGAPRYTATSSGLTYVSAPDEYQVVALDAAGQARWALRVAWERHRVSEEDKREFMSRVPEPLAARGFDTSNAEWPELLGSISRLALDGSGRLYVFPTVSASVMPPGADAPVDVYSPDGERLLSGEMTPFEWTAASGDFIYGIRENDDTGEREPVRYRLVLPGEE